MSRMTTYTQGRFSWIDLHTPDAATAQSFYADLFGWQSKNQSTDQGGVYTMFQQDGLDICGMGEMGGAMVQSGSPACRRPGTTTCPWTMPMQWRRG